MAEIEAELASIEAQHDELRQAAQAAGIELPEIEAVRQRRQAEEDRARPVGTWEVRGGVGGR